MLRRAGYDDVTVFERGERIGGVWHHNTYPGAACDIPSHLYEFSFDAEPALVAPLRPPGRDPGIPRGCRAAPRCDRQDPHRYGGEERGLGRRAQPVGAGHQQPGSTRPRSCSPPAASSRCRPCRRSRDSRASAARRSTRRNGGTTSSSPASGWPCWAPAAARSRWCRRSSRSSTTSTSTSARRAGPSRRWTSPTRSARSACSSASPSLQRLDRNGDLRLHGARRRRRSRATRWLLRPFRAIARRQINKAIEDPELRSKVTPADEIGCKRIMLTDDWYPTLTKPNVELVADRIAEVTPGRHPHRRRHRAPGRRARPRHGLQDPWLRRADGDRRRGRPYAGRGVVGRRRARTSG